MKTKYILLGLFVIGILFIGPIFVQGVEGEEGTNEDEDKDGITDEVEDQPAFTKKRKRSWFEKYRWFKSTDGFLVIGGRDATTNDILIKKHLEDNDMVFHADIQGAPFFVVKNPDKDQKNEVLIPALESVILEIDLKRQVIRVDLPEGL